MILLVGLGNWEDKYLKNRHNVGFHFVDHLIKKYNFIQNSKIEKKIEAFCFEGISSLLLDNLQKNFDKIQSLKNKKDRISYNFPEDKEFTLIKPKTFMNASGKSILKFISIKKPSTIIVIYDDIETDIGRYKFTINSNGSGGHNGIRSIISSIGDKFIKLKIGINNIKTKEMNSLSDFVLSDFEEKEFKILEDLFIEF